MFVLGTTYTVHSLVLFFGRRRRLTWERVHGNGDAERVVAGNQAKDGRVDLIHVQWDAVQRAIVGLF